MKGFSGLFYFENGSWVWKFLRTNDPVQNRKSYNYESQTLRERERERSKSMFKAFVPREKPYIWMILLTLPILFLQILFMYSKYIHILMYIRIIIHFYLFYSWNFRCLSVFCFWVTEFLEILGCIGPAELGVPVFFCFKAFIFT